MFGERVPERVPSALTAVFTICNEARLPPAG